jgi:hypothetical protein
LPLFHQTDHDAAGAKLSQIRSKTVSDAFKLLALLDPKAFGEPNTHTAASVALKQADACQLGAKRSQEKSFSVTVLMLWACTHPRLTTDVTGCHCKNTAVERLSTRRKLARKSIALQIASDVIK